MEEGSIRVLTASDIADVLSGNELEIMERTKLAYIAHAAGESNLPQSVFLRFPQDEMNRIIALPAYLGDGFQVAGIKWISSFPANIHRGMERASAAVILNSMVTGRPEVLLEGSLISAKRTAASAALAARYLAPEDVTEAGMIGCGVINFEILNFLSATRPSFKSVVLFDLDPQRAQESAERCRASFPALKVQVAAKAQQIFSRCRLISFATTAIRPHIGADTLFHPGAVILHVSLRDLTPEVILNSVNVVDDVEHVCRAQTSIHMAEQQAGNRNFIAGTLADVLSGRMKVEAQGRVTIFSPFGLGMLDLAVADYVRHQAVQHGRGTEIAGFHPEPLKQAAGV